MFQFKPWSKIASKKSAAQERRVEAGTVVDEPDGAVVIDGFSHYGQSFAGYNALEPARDEAEQVKIYRSLLSNPEVEYAVDDIVNEAITTDTDDNSVEINLDSVDISEGLKEKVREEFNNILKIMKFQHRGYDYFKTFYVDGRIGFHKIIDKDNLKKGLIGIRMFDSVALTKVREVQRDEDGAVIDFSEYFIYDESMLAKTSKRLRYNGKKLQLPKDSVSYITSGEFQPENGLIKGKLHDAIKWANNLSMLEDATVVYRYSRAPEKRIFYIDTGNLPPSKAESFVGTIKNRYRNKIIYDPASGGVKDKKNLLTMYDDFWLPRSASGRGTEVDTLEGGQNLGQIDDIIYFRKKLYQSLKIPVSRVEQEGVVQFGRVAEITRDELKFTKGVHRERRKFAEIFNDLLRTQLRLKNVFNDSEWLNICDDIRYEFAEDAYLAQEKEFEILQSKVEVIRDMREMIGKYVSHDWIMKRVLRMSDEEIEEEGKKIIEEKGNKRFEEPEDGPRF